MAFCNPQLRRLLIILMSLSVLSSATDHRHKQPHSDHGSHDVANRTVVLNSASEWYLALIFHDYSDNTTRTISAARFKDLLRDLSLGEKVPNTKSSSQQEHESHHRNSRSYDEQEGAFGEFARRILGQRSTQKRRSTTQSKREMKSQLELVPLGSPAKTRDRKRRNLEDHLDEPNEVSY